MSKTSTNKPGIHINTYVSYIRPSCRNQHPWSARIGLVNYYSRQCYRNIHSVSSIRPNTNGPQSPIRWDSRIPLPCPLLWDTGETFNHHFIRKEKGKIKEPHIPTWPPLPTEYSPHNPSANAPILPQTPLFCYPHKLVNNTIRMCYWMLDSFTLKMLLYKVLLPCIRESLARRLRMCPPLHYINFRVFEILCQISSPGIRVLICARFVEEKIRENFHIE